VNFAYILKRKEYVSFVKKKVSMFHGLKHQHPNECSFNTCFQFQSMSIRIRGEYVKPNYRGLRPNLYRVKLLPSLLSQNVSRKLVMLKIEPIE